MERQESHLPQGFVVGPGGRGSSGVPEQFRQAARIFAMEVLPVPREPTKR